MSVRNDATLLWLQANGSFAQHLHPVRRRAQRRRAPPPRVVADARPAGRRLPPVGAGRRHQREGGDVDALGAVPSDRHRAPRRPRTTTTTTTSTTTTSTTTTTTTRPRRRSAPTSTTAGRSGATSTPTPSASRNGTYRWDQTPFRYTASSARFQRGASARRHRPAPGRRRAPGTPRSPWHRSLTRRTAGGAAVRAYLSASIEGEAICGGMVFDNFSLPMVQYIADLYTVGRGADDDPHLRRRLQRGVRGLHLLAGPEHLALRHHGAHAWARRTAPSPPSSPNRLQGWPRRARAVGC